MQRNQKKYWTTKTFRQLRDKWYLKLDTSGFKDQEKVIAGEPQLSQYASNAYRQASDVVRDAKLRYYELMAQLMNDNKPDDEVDLIVMTKWIEGNKIKDISAELKRKGKRCHRQTIRYIIRKYENRWEVKKWKPEQMRSSPPTK